MGISPEAEQFAQFLGGVTDKTATPGLDIAVIRDVVDAHQHERSSRRAEERAQHRLAQLDGQRIAARARMIGAGDDADQPRQLDFLYK